MISESALQAFRASLRGQLVVPKDAEYDEVRRIHNAMINRRPGAIVRCAGVADVVAAVNFARQSNLLVAVRGAGHNAAGSVDGTKALVDGTLPSRHPPLRGGSRPPPTYSFWESSDPA